MKDNCALKPLLIKFPPLIASLSHVSRHYVEDPYVSRRSLNQMQLNNESRNLPSRMGSCLVHKYNSYFRVFLMNISVTASTLINEKGLVLRYTDAGNRANLFKNL